MKTVVFYERADVPVEKIMEVYPRHKLLVDAFANDKKVIAIGSFADISDGSMGIFIDRETAEDFVRQDPFVREGLVANATVKEWNEILLP